MTDSIFMPDPPTDPNPLRRQMDTFYLTRFAEMSKAIDHLNGAFEDSLKAFTDIQNTQTRLMERITTFNEKFAEHDERESEDRARLINTLDQLSRTLAAHDRQLERHTESIASLKLWDLLLASAIGALAAGGSAWIIQHLQTTFAR